MRKRGEDDPELRRLLGETAWLIREHGPRSDAVRDFVRKNVSYPEFKELAYTLVLLKERFTAEEAERRLFGKGPVCDRCQGDGLVETALCERCGGTGDEPATLPEA
jgi:hypothetical protein